MKRILLILITVLFFQLAPYCQEGTANVTKSYFRSDPFKNDFSVFLKSVITDPQLISKKVLQRTDSSFFTVYGLYQNFNPFFFKPKKVAMILTESEAQYIDSVKVYDTIFIYQIQAIANYDKDGLADIKKEFEKVHRNIKRGFYKNNYSFTGTQQDMTGEVYNYFEELYAVAPVSLVWEIRDNELILSITIRMKMNANQAVLPAPFYAPQ